MSTTTKKTISIPSTVGSSSLSEVFGKITFTREVKDLLAALDAEVVVRYMPGAEKPAIQVLNRSGKNVCTLEEFQALSGYRRFVADALKEIAKVSSTDEKVHLVGFFLRKFKGGPIPAPARILEQNLTKFNQIGSSIQMIAKHLEVIETTIDNEWRKYALAMIERITRILHTALKVCMGPTIMEKGFIEDELFEARVPKWVYTKFLDKNFTNNLKENSQTLFFPKNNYLKSISLTTKEIQDEDFVFSNHLVTKYSKSIALLAATDFSALFPPHPDQLAEAIKNYLENYYWTMIAPTSVDDLLTIRESGKLVPVFREALPPKRTGKNSRPESDVAKITRNIGNVLGKIQATYIGIMNLVVPVANPRTEFWINLFSNAEHWEITPTHSIYNAIRDESTHNATLEKLRTSASSDTLTLISYVIAQALNIPAASVDAKMITTALESVEKNQVYEDSVAKAISDITTKHPLVNTKELKDSPLTDTEVSETKAFLGLKAQQTSDRKKRSGAAAVRLGPSVRKELKPIAELKIYDPVKNWLMTTFKTGDRNALQLLAAERILGEVLKHQEDLFDDFDEDDELQELEEYDAEDEY